MFESARPGGGFSIERAKVLGISPFHAPSARVVSAVSAGGGVGVLDIGGPSAPADLALRRLSGCFGIRVPFGTELTPSAVENTGAVPELVVLGWRSPWSAAELPGAPLVLAEVTDIAEARAALADGAHGLIARGSEAGGKVGELTSFVLLQQLLGCGDISAPVWACGGIGPFTARAALAAGAAGIVLDSQLSLLAESDVPGPTRAAIERMDGSETVLRGGHRVLRGAAEVDGEIEVAGSLGPLAATGTMVPVGQDGHLAADFAARFGTAREAVRALRADISAPTVVDPLAQGAPVRGSFGTELAIAQGPMTRVSDEPAFAKAVADGGGMPFVAVALADARRTEDLLRTTARMVGDRPWGAGILGFVSEDLRAAQLEVILRLRPHSVLIAGGNPAQAKALEAEGIHTYLHVPSPILLRQFLEAGARRFVFEGAECGGHIGPRSSFSLWESQIAVLSDYLGDNPTADGIEVLFAGGIHDARSAAMVAAMAAPLAERGVGIGVLMGTAYLFTEEAVRHGAITSTFQHQAVAADRTATLETGPGHQTRCLQTPFVAEFEAASRQLRETELEAGERRQRLEDLNVGRLRIASKGIRRDGEQLVSIDTAEQLAAGMYMAGQVAVLRSAVCDIAALHREVTAGAAEFLRAGQQQEQFDAESADSANADEIAIIGMSCAFAGAPDTEAFWSLVMNAGDAVTEVPTERWDPEVYYHPDGDVAGASVSKWGGFLPPIPFDPMSFGIPPASMGSIDPAQLLALEITRRALADAGYAVRPFDRENTSVIFGAEAGSDLLNAETFSSLLPAYVEEAAPEITTQLPRLTEDSFPGTLSNVIAGRIANRLDLGGANYTVDAACGTSLAALDLACKELRGGTSDLVLCGAVDLHNGINDYLMFDSAGALSPTGKCRPFDSSADGIALGEGVACLVLKRRADAERDGDRVYAVVKGTGAASDGKSMGLTAPRMEGQLRALHRAYRQAGVSPADIGLIEAHGTGTVVGDGTELNTLTGFFSEAGAAPGECALGSVKSQIGHTKCAAGMAGLIKAALSMWHGVLPPTLNLSEPHPKWSKETSPFSFTTSSRPWAVPASKRFAGVSAFGFGGTNFHAVLGPGEATASRHTVRDWDSELFLFRGKDEEQARAALRTLLGRLDTGTESLAELAADVGRRADRSREPVRFAIVAADHAELRAALSGERGLLRPGDTEAGKLAYLFSGQGSQRTGMLADVLVHFPDLLQVAELAPEVAAVTFPAAAFDAETSKSQAEALRDTTMAQPALGMVQSALCALLDRLGVRPDQLAGHSYGELAALAAAGSFDTASLLRLSAKRAECILDAAGGDPGAMAAVSASLTEAQRVLDAAGLAGQVVFANHNTPSQYVLSGPTVSVERAVAALRENGIGAKALEVACAFHSPLVSAAGQSFAAALDTETVREPRLPVWSNATARQYQPGEVRAKLSAQLGSPVRFVEQIEDMYAAGARVFAEIGPGRVLAGLVGKILGDRPHTTVALGDGAGMRGVLTAIARLAVSGIDVRTEWLFRDRVAVTPHEGADTKPATWVVDGRCARRADGTPVPNGLVPAKRTQVMSMADPMQQQSAAERAVVEYLRSTREIVAAQRDVLLGFLGTQDIQPSTAARLQALPVAEPLTVHQPAIVAAAPVAAAAPEPAPVLDVLSSVVEIISDRTGYPAEMIEPDLDLEADLSIDSIKRTEIAGTLIGKLGVRDRVADDGQDELSRKRTVQGIADWIEQYRDPATESSAAPAPTVDDVPRGLPPRRYLQRGVAAPLASAQGELGTVLLLHDDGELGAAVRVELENRGASVCGAGSAQAVLYIVGAQDEEEPVAPQVFSRIRSALADGARTIMVGCPEHAAVAKAGLRGLLRAVAKEYPEVRVRLVEFDAADQQADICAAVVAELRAPDSAPVVLRSGAQRTALEVTEHELEPGTEAPVLEAGAVLLVIGGARGITARCAREIAEASGCRVELAGRTAWTGETGETNTAAELRSSFAAKGIPLADIESRVNETLAKQEISRTVQELRAAGSSVGYRSVDVRDTAAIGQLVKDVYADHGRIDGVIYAAGVIDDKLLADKDEASFRTVFDTKVDGARALLGALSEFSVPVRFVTLFGSIAAVFGNRGQTDYAAANDALETLGAAWSARTGRRALTVHWGPWAPSASHPGMVSAELAREYERRNIALLDPDDGARALLRELSVGPHDVNSVVYTAGLW